MSLNRLYLIFVNASACENDNATAMKIGKLIVNFTELGLARTRVRNFGNMFGLVKVNDKTARFKLNAPALVGCAEYRLRLFAASVLRCRLINSILILLAVITATPAMAVETTLSLNIAYIARNEEPFVSLSLLDIPVENDGLLGAQLGLRDNQTTGEFLGHEYILHEIILDDDVSIANEATQWAKDDLRVFIADLRAEDLLALADAVPDALIFNARAPDDELRNDDCRRNVLHILPSRAMLTDALAQYLAWKRWTKLAVAIGRHPEDQAYATSLKRAAKRFGLKIVEEKNWTAEPGARRTDSGHHSLQSEVPVFTQFKDHDVLVVADEADEFGEYMMFHTTRARPVVGTQGLTPTSWHRSQEQWGATQIQRRFEKLSGRWMTARDYAAWAAMRVLGETVTNTASDSTDTLRDFILSDKLKLAAFKGVALNFRNWNGQLRQPILLSGPRMLVSVSPQDGFLHEFTELDTMGFDEPESSCSSFK